MRLFILINYKRIQFISNESHFFFFILMISVINNREKLFQHKRFDFIMKAYNQAFIIIIINISDFTKKPSIRKIAAFYDIVYIYFFKRINDQINFY